MKRIVVTGMGFVTPLGCDIAEVCEKIYSGESGIKLLQKLDSSIFNDAPLFAGQVYEKSFLDNIGKENENIEDPVLYALAAAKSCFLDSGLNVSSEIENNFGVIVGTTHGCSVIAEKIIEKYGVNFSSYQFSDIVIKKLKNFSPSLINYALSKYLGFNGCSILLQAVCASGNYAIATACSKINNEEGSVYMVGGTDSISKIAYSSLYGVGAISFKNCAPFSKDRDGTIPGEGAGMLIVEELEHAQNRGARIYCEIKGSGFACDAYHLISPSPDGSGLEKAIRNALYDAKVTSEMIDLICVHGTGTKQNDLQEYNAIQGVFGDKKLKSIPIVSLKPTIGHCLGAANIIETILTIMFVKNEIIPATLNTNKVDENFKSIFLLLDKALKWKAKLVLNNAIGFGGNICSIIISKF